MSRELPHSNEAEQAILGGMMIYPNVTGVVFDQKSTGKRFLSGYSSAYFLCYDGHL